MDALGDRFRAAREARGLSLSDVAGQIHIRSVYLAAIEAHDWESIGAPVYVRGFLRTYARFLGLDPEAAVQAFNEERPPAAPPTGVATPSAAVAVASGRQGARPRGPVLGIVAAVVAILVVGYVGFQYWLYQANGEPKGVVAVATPAATASGEATAAPVATATPLPKPSAAIVHGLVIRLAEASWLRVTVDGKVAIEGTFPKGTTRTFHGKAADLRVGNAGGVRVAIDGRDVGSLGADGDVVERSFVLGG